MFRSNILLIFIIKACRMWHEMGHYMIARIAEQKLANESPETLQQIYSMLRPLEKFFPERGNSMLEPAIVSDLLATQYNGFLSYYHYTDMPFPYKNDRMADLKFNDPFVYNVTYAYTSGVSVIKESLNPPQETHSRPRYIKTGFIDSLMLRYIIHIVGDVHQPLHSTMLYSKHLYNGTLQTGDMAGNLIPVNDIFKLNITNLHMLWDSVFGAYELQNDMPLSTPAIDYIEKTTNGLMGEYPELYFGDAAKSININDWVDESNKIAIDFVYSDIDIFPNVRPQYVNEGRKIAKSRVALAGYRLAYVLMDMFKKPTIEAQLL